MPKAMWICVVLCDDGYHVKMPELGTVSKHPQAALAIVEAEQLCEINNGLSGGQVDWLVDVCDLTAEVMGFIRS